MTSFLLLSSLLTLIAWILPACAMVGPRPADIPDPNVVPSPAMETPINPTATPTTSPTETPAGLRILALGDSYTIGESVSPSDRWPVQVAQQLNERGIDVPEPLIIARTGWTTDELDAALDASDPSGPFALVTLLIGVNDQYRGRSVEDYRPKFRALLERAVALTGGSAKRVLVLSIPDWSVTPFAMGLDSERIAVTIDAFNRANREETRLAGSRYIDITGISRQVVEDGEMLATDGLHPSGKMYAAWVALVLPEALEALNWRE